MTSVQLIRLHSVDSVVARYNQPSIISVHRPHHHHHHYHHIYLPMRIQMHKKLICRLFTVVCYTKANMGLLKVAVNGYLRVSPYSLISFFVYLFIAFLIVSCYHIIVNIDD